MTPIAEFVPAGLWAVSARATPAGPLEWIVKAGAVVVTALLLYASIQALAASLRHATAAGESSSTRRAIDRLGITVFVVIVLNTLAFVVFRW